MAGAFPSARRSGRNPPRPEGTPRRRTQPPGADRQGGGPRRANPRPATERAREARGPKSHPPLPLPPRWGLLPRRLPAPAGNKAGGGEGKGGAQGGKGKGEGGDRAGQKTPRFSPMRRGSSPYLDTLVIIQGFQFASNPHGYRTHGHFSWWKKIFPNMDKIDKLEKEKVP